MQETPRTGLQDDGSYIIKLYFDGVGKKCKCLGGGANEWWQKDFSEDYISNAFFHFPEGIQFDPIGKTGPEIEAAGAKFVC